MRSHLDAAHRQHEVTKNNNNSFIDLLAVLVIGAISMVATLLGVLYDNPYIFIPAFIGFIASVVGAIAIATGSVANAGKAIIEFLSSYRNYKGHTKNKDQ